MCRPQLARFAILLDALRMELGLAVRAMLDGFGTLGDARLETKRALGRRRWYAADLPPPRRQSFSRRHGEVMCNNTPPAALLGRKIPLTGTWRSLSGRFQNEGK